MQNLDTWEAYGAALDRDQLPLGRAYRPVGEERMIREFVLQLKRGSIRPAYFREKYDVDVLRRFHDQLAALRAEGYASRVAPDRVELSREGLMRVDSLLPRFFLPQHVGIRYT
jgi:oxygen-independent coproporphyrinogen-3 oxidase